jgi:hypothetical protein
MERERDLSSEQTSREDLVSSAVEKIHGFNLAVQTLRVDSRAVEEAEELKDEALSQLSPEDQAKAVLDAAELWKKFKTGGEQ